MAEGRKGFFGRLVEGLAKTRSNIVSGIDSIFSGFSAIDDDFYEEIEGPLSWEIWESRPPCPLWRICARR